MKITSKSLITRALIALVGFLAASAAASASTATFTWDGITDNTWTTPTNWVGNTAPTGTSNEVLVFKVGSGNLPDVPNNNFPAASFGAIVFGGTVNTLPSVVPFTLTGNATTLTGTNPGAGNDNVIVNVSNVSQTVSFGGTGITLSGLQSTEYFDTEGTTPGGNLSITSNIVLNNTSLGVTNGGNLANTTTISGVISGSGGGFGTLFLTSGTTLILTQANTFTAPGGGVGTFFVGGKLDVVSGALGSDSIEIDGSDSVLTDKAAAGATTTLANAITADTDFTVTPVGSIVLNGDVTLQTGFNSTLTITDTTPSANASVTLGGAIGDAGENIGLTLTGNLAGNGGAHFIMNGAGSNTYTGLTDVENETTLDLAKTGGAVAVAGNLTVEVGSTVNLMQSNQIANTSNTTVLGLLDLQGNTDTIKILAGSGNVTSSVAGGDLIVNDQDSGDVQSFTGNITGGMSLALNAGTFLTLSGNDTYTGTTHISIFSDLAAGSPTALSATSNFDVNGTLDLNGNNSTIGALRSGLDTGLVTNNASGAVILTTNNNSSVDTVYSGSIQDGQNGTIGLTKNGSNTLTLFGGNPTLGSNTYSGETTINGGTLQAGAGSGTNKAFSPNSDVQMNGLVEDPVLDLNGNNETIASLNGTSGNTVTSGNTAAVLTTLTINDGNSSSAALVNTLVVNGATYALGYRFDGTIVDGSGSPLALVKEGEGAFYLTGANTYSGGTTLADNGAGDAGTIIVGNSTALGTGAVLVNTPTTFTTDALATYNLTNAVTLNATLTADIEKNSISSLPATLQISGNVSGASPLIKTGAGILYLSGNNSFTGGTFFNDNGDENAGTVEVGNSSAFGTGAVTVNVTSTISSDGLGAPTYNVANAVVLNAGLTADIEGASSPLQLSGNVTGVGPLTKTGAGTLYLSGINTYSGGTFFNNNGAGNAGTVEIGRSTVGTGATLAIQYGNPIVSGPLGTGTVTVNASTILTTDGGVTGNNYTLLNNFTLNTAGTALTVTVPNAPGGLTGTNLTLVGQFSGPGGLTLNGNLGSLILYGAFGAGPVGDPGNIYAGPTVINSGTMQAATGSGNGNAFSPFSDYTLNGTSTLDLNGNSETIASLNSSSATTTVTNSALTGPVTLTVNDTNLRAGAPTTYEYAGTITDSGSANALNLSTAGTGTLVLAGSNTYTGNTSIAAGSKLAVGNNHALGSGTLANHQGNVTNSGVLETTATSGTVGTGFVPGPLVKKIGVNGNYIQTGTGNLSLQAVINQGLPPTTQAAAGVAYDTLAVTGTANLSGTMNLNFQAAASPIRGQQFQIVSSAAANVTSALPIGASATGTVPKGFIPITTYNDNFNGRFANNNVVVTMVAPLSTVAGLTPNQRNVAANVDQTVFNSLTTTSYANGLNGANGGTTPSGFGGTDVFVLGGVTGPQGTSKDFFDNIVTGLNLSAFNGELGAALDELSPQRLEILHNVAFDNYALDIESLDSEFARERNGLGGINTSGFAFNDAELGPQLSQIKSRLLAWNPAPSAGLLSDSSQAILGGVEMSDGKNMNQAAYEPPVHQWNAFIDGGADLGDLEHNIDESHASYTTGRVRGGVDYRVNANIRVGGLFGYAHTDADLDNEGSKAHVDSFTPGIFATYADKDGFFANGVFTGTANDYSTNRKIVIPGVSRTAHGSTDGAQFGFDLDGGYEFHADKWTFGPGAGLTYVNLGISSFTETGAGAANLAINSQSADSLRSRLGGTVSYQGKVASVLLTPHFDIYWQHEYLDRAATITSQFQGLPGGTFSVATTKGDSDSALLGFGLDADITNCLTLFLDYQTEAGGSTFFGQSASAGVKYGF